ncbi:MAG TPA: thermonuclease family protein [Xanthobacteraceae bacterium]|nr:thermonuclease family protein [Xanthobacteraceae bacterium]
MARFCDRIVRAGAVAFTALFAPLGQSHSQECGGVTLAAGAVRAVIDGRTLALTDGTVVRLAGLDLPSGDDPSTKSLAAQAKAFLESLASGRTITAKSESRSRDRYGRVPAYVFLTEGLEGPLQRAILARGFARVAARAGERICAGGLLASERRAREAGLGLWGDPRHAVQRAEDFAAVMARRGTFALIEGRVVSVRESGGTIFVNFGRRWSEDFTVTIAKRNERTLVGAGLNPKSLERRFVRVRGFVEERGGPWIEVTRPEQVEVIGN